MILVTGGTGFVGHYLLKALVERGETVRATYRKSSNPDRMNDFPSVDWVECDVLDIVGLEKAFKGVERVYHVAAMVSYVPAHSEIMKQINVDGTRNIANICLEKGVEKLIFVSSIAALGRPINGKEISEKDEWTESKLNSPYAKSKYEAEMEIWRAGAEGLNFAIVNPSVVLGEWDWDSGTAQFF